MPEPKTVFVRSGPLPKDAARLRPVGVFPHEKVRKGLLKLRDGKVEPPPCG